MKKYKKVILISTLLAISLIICFFVLYKKEIKNIDYLVLGDSISAGYGLDNIEDSYADITSHNIKDKYLTEEDDKMNMNNLAINGLNSSELLSMIQSGEIEVSDKVDIITLSIGANDLLGPFQDVLASCFNSDRDNLQKDIVQNIFNDPQETLRILEKLNSEEGLVNNSIIKESAEKFGYTFFKIIEAIKDKAPKAKIYVMNLYNPYKDFDINYLLGEINLGDISEDYIQLINNQLSNKSKDYVLVDVYSEFNDSEESLVKANADTFNFDPHPNEKGHATIAKLFSKEIEKTFSNK